MRLSSHLPFDHPDFKVIFDFELLDDTYADWNKDNTEPEVASMGSRGSSDDLMDIPPEDNVNILTPEVQKYMEMKEVHPLALMVSYLVQMDPENIYKFFH